MSNRRGFYGLIAAQEEIIAHWNAVRNGRDLPLKSDIDPGVLRAHLASISMIEVDLSGEARFRLVGTRLRQILGGDMRGRSLRDVERDKAEMWSLGLAAVIEREEPIGGIIPRAADRHAWLRLPLEPGASAARLVLCHDVILTAEPEKDRDPSTLFSPLTGRLAA